jgi:hypothetical protein
MCTEYPMSRAYKITGSTSEAKKAVSASIFGSPQLSSTTLSNTQSAAKDHGKYHAGKFRAFPKFGHVNVLAWDLEVIYCPAPSITVSDAA